MHDSERPADTTFIALPRDLLLQASHVLDDLEQAPNLADATADRRPRVDQRTLTGILRAVALLVHHAELSTTAGRVIAAGLCPAAGADTWTEVVHTVGLHHDLDAGLLPWNTYDESLPAGIEPRQAIAADLAEQDAAAAIWVMLNPGRTRCVRCVRMGREPWRIGAAMLGGRMCGPCLCRDALARQEASRGPGARDTHRGDAV